MPHRDIPIQQHRGFRRVKYSGFPTASGDEDYPGGFAETVLESTQQAVVIVDKHQRRIVYVNPAFLVTTGYSVNEVKGKSLFDFRSGRHNTAFFRQIWRSLEEKGYWSGEIWGRRKNGETYPSLHTISPIFNSAGRVTHYVSMFSDITALKRQQANLGHLAYHDPLTGLPNRLMLVDRLDHALRAHIRNKMNLAVLFMDLDGFKLINDRLGHAIGDQLLQMISERLQALLRSGDTVARLGGDEFVVVIESCRSRAGIVRIAEKLIETIAEPLHIDGHELEVRVSIGIAVAPQDGQDTDTIMDAADQAMYRVKTRQGGDFCFFDESPGNY
jgi:diguanylate cyclase (GGDEF)-like protein/PAS domain S-box-containing protein